MKATTLALVNTSILTSYGTFNYRPLPLGEARALVREFERDGKTIKSAVGHQSTAELLSVLLEFEVPANRIELEQSTNDLALIFKLKQRPPEGKVLNRAEIEEIGYEFGLLTRLS
jgi:Domain of unknown function (DUF1874)